MERADRFEFSTDIWVRDHGDGYDYVNCGQNAVITDFSRANGDKIVVSSGEHPWVIPVFVENGYRTGADFELSYHKVRGASGQTNTVIDMVVGGEEWLGDAVLEITLRGYSGSLQASDFILA